MKHAYFIQDWESEAIQGFEVVLRQWESRLMTAYQSAPTDSDVYRYFFGEAARKLRDGHAKGIQREEATA